jgi:hypothetical protein
VLNTTTTPVASFGLLRVFLEGGAKKAASFAPSSRRRPKKTKKAVKVVVTSPLGELPSIGHPCCGTIGV